MSELILKEIVGRKFFIHIGMHKTATSTLQAAVFPRLNEYLYCPRVLELENCIYSNLIRFCFFNQDSCLPILKEQIESSSKDILISEEWFLSTYDGFTRTTSGSWHCKIKRLRLLFASLEAEPVVVVTMRNPESGLLSHYREFYEAFGGSRYKSVSEFFDSEEGELYDYPSLSDYLNLNFSEVHYLKFNKDNISDYERGWSNILKTSIFLSSKFNAKNIIDSSGTVKVNRPIVVLLSRFKLARKLWRLLKFAFPWLESIKKVESNLDQQSFSSAKLQKSLNWWRKNAI